MRVFFFLALLLSVPPAFAYLDPASGSALLYIIISSFGAVIYFIHRMVLTAYIRVRAFFLNEPMQANTQDLVFYSEHKGYWSVFSPIIQSLVESEQQCLYLTSDKNDPGLEYSHAFFSAKYIGSVNVAAIQLNHLEAKVVVMTTPQLDVHHFRRSKNVQHYSHVVHAPVDVHTYKKFAFDYFDSVLCSNEQQINSIRALEKTRRTKIKDLRCVGLTYYDRMLEELSVASKSNEHASHETDNLHVLVAPTWKPYSIINCYGADFFKPLLDAGMKVTLRPHPQTYTSFPEIVKNIELELSSYSNFTIDREASSVAAMLASDLMIADLSGVIWDYTFLHKKPLLTVSTPVDLDGFEATELDHEAWELSAIKERFTVVQPTQFFQLDDIVRQATDEYDPERYNSKALINLGSAGAAAAQELKGILEGLAA